MLTKRRSMYDYTWLKFFLSITLVAGEMKRIIVLTLTAMILFIGISSAAAANWIELSRSKDVICSVDLTTVKRKGNTFRMWNKAILRSSPIQVKFKEILKSAVSQHYSVEYREYKIDEPVNRFISVTYYAKDGKVISTSGEEQTWSFSPLGSFGETMWQLGKSALGIK